MSGIDPREWNPPTLREAADDDSDTYTVAVRGGDAPACWSLAFMACDVIDEQEIGLAMDTYCLVVDPGQATHYGGVLECELSGDALRLRLTVEAAEILGLRSDNIFPLELPEEQHTLLSRGLRRVLSSGRPDAIPARLDV